MTVSLNTGSTVTTDTSGGFSFASLANGSYIVTPSKTGYTFNPTSSAQALNSANITGISFTATTGTASTYSISGTVTFSGTALQGVTITLSGPGSATATSDASGNYTFTGLANGAYTLTPSKTGYTFNPASSAQTVNTTSITGVTFTATASSNSTAGLVAYYPFSGNANDLSGNGNNGTVSGATLTTDRFGNANSAYSFNGTSSMIIAPSTNLPLGNLPRTISAWVKPVMVSGDHYIAGWGQGLTGQWSSINIYQGQFRFIGLNGPDVVGTSNVVANVWYHITAAYDGTVLRLYANGSEIANSTISLNTTSGNIVIGNLTETGGSYFKGAIDDVRIYNSALSASEIQTLYTSQ